MSFLILLITLTALIFIHELGHLMAARGIGVKVRTISIGFGRSLFSYQDRTGTLWKLSIFPLGGFVKLEDDNRTNLDSCNQSSTKFFKSVIVVFLSSIIIPFMDTIIFSANNLI